jgi:hypothetical protein
MKKIAVVLFLSILGLSSCKKRGTCFSCEMYQKSSDLQVTQAHVGLPEKENISMVEDLLLESSPDQQSFPDSYYDSVKCKVISPKEYCQ